MAFAQPVTNHIGYRNDPGTSTTDRIPNVALAESAATQVDPAVVEALVEALTARGYYDRQRELVLSTAALELAVDIPPTSESLTALDFAVASVVCDEDMILDELLASSPTKTYSIRLRLTHVGKGKPILQSDADLNLFDD